GAHSQLGIIGSFLGNLEAAREHLELALTLLGPGPYRNFSEAQYAQAAATLLSTTLLMLGYPAAALRKSREFIDTMRRSDPASLVRALMRDAINYIGLRDSRATLERAQEVLSIATELGMAFNAASVAFFRGWSLVYEGQGEAGLAEMLRVLPDLEGTA